MNKNRLIKLAAVSGLLVGLTSLAHATGPDLTPVTDNLTTLATAILGVAGAVIAGAMGLFAIMKGGVWIKRLWGKFTA